jgi:hypothetical protein
MIVLVEPVLAVWLLILLLALGLLFMGMDRLVIGISGQPMWWIAPIMPSGTAPASPPAPKP